MVLKRTVVDMLNYSHPGDHTRRCIDGLVFGGFKSNSSILINSKLISLHSVGYLKKVSVLFTIDEFFSLSLVFFSVPNLHSRGKYLEKDIMWKLKGYSYLAHRVDKVWHLALRSNVPKGLAASTALCFLESQKRVIIDPFKPSDEVITVPG